MTRNEILDAAAVNVTGHRESEYGSPENNFTLIAKLWAAYLDTEVSAVDVASMMSLLKIARIKGKTMTEDSFIDLAGYAACGGEIATSEKAKAPTTKKDQLKQFIQEMDEKYGARVDTIDLSHTPVAPKMPERTVKGWTVYRHFKGNLYRVMDVAEHTETGEKFVIYRALYGTGKVYARPVDMFLSPVDRKKYPNATQEYRFEAVEP